MRNLFASAKGLAALIGAAVALFAVVATANAVSGDRNRDGIPDRWAKRHHLSNKVNQASRDQDKDRVDNLCEYESNMDPRDPNSDDDRRRDGREDSDHDGMVNFVESEVDSGCDDDDSDDDGQEDGDEISGYVHSLDGDVLKLRMVDGTILSAPLADGVYVHCHREEFAEKPKPEEEHVDDPPADDGAGDDGAGDDVKSAQYDGAPHEGDCGIDALVPGAVVKAFYVEDGVFVKIKLLL